MEILGTLGVRDVLEQLHAAGISVWLDSESRLRIDKDASTELKDLVREHKEALVAVKSAVRLMNAAGIRIIRLPLGHLALAYRLGTDLEAVRHAMKVLGKEAMPLVINDEGLRPLPWHEWQSRQPVRVVAEFQPMDDRKPALPPRFGRKTA